MVKLNIVTRTDKDFQRETKHDIHKVHRSLDPINHPHSRAREYQRAVTASKINKIFAKPFLFSLDAHSDAISCFGKAYEKLEYTVSGGFDGEIVAWDLPGRRAMSVVQAYEG